ncbi:uncharacterized protein DS421_7g211880 [Arachis hypogaea]|nr:uncharacterized protein DS421_7g211880 [Arachis hypogaea]
MTIFFFFDRSKFSIKKIAKRHLYIAENISDLKLNKKIDKFYIELLSERRRKVRLRRILYKRNRDSLRSLLFLNLHSKCCTIETYLLFFPESIQKLSETVNISINERSSLYLHPEPVNSPVTHP